MAVTEFLTSASEWLRQITPDEVKAYYWAAARIYTSPLFYFGVVSILFVERIRPAVRDQRLLSRGFAEDFGWFQLDLAFKVAALPAFAGLLSMLYHEVTGGFRLEIVASLPLGWKVAVSLLLFDFLQWLHHRVRHKVTAFWHFHVIHHSQRQLNLFTDLRVHFVEYLVARVIEFVPMLMFGLTPFAIMGVGLATSWYTRLIHANVRTNFGPLGHLVVSPQYHRVHHSIEPQHTDRNFGVILTVWDRMFGTMYKSFDEYPRTGVVGVEFVPPGRWAPGPWVRHFWRQLVWPFSQLVRGSTPRPESPVDRHRDGSSHDRVPPNPTPLDAPLASHALRPSQH